MRQLDGPDGAGPPRARGRALEELSPRARRHHHGLTDYAPASSSSSTRTGAAGHPFALIERPTRVHRAGDARAPTRARRSRGSSRTGPHRGRRAGLRAYYPPSHYHLLDSFSPRRFKDGLARPVHVYGAEAGTTATSCSSRSSRTTRVHRPHRARRPDARGRAPDRRSVAAGRGLRAPDRAAHRAPARRRELGRAGPSARRSSTASRARPPVAREEEVFRAAHARAGPTARRRPLRPLMLRPAAGRVRNVAEYAAHTASTAARRVPVAPSRGSQGASRHGRLAFEERRARRGHRHAYETS